MSTLKLMRYIPDIMERDMAFTDVDFDTELKLKGFKLHVQNVLTKGERLTKRHYASAVYNEATTQIDYSDLVIEENYTFERGDNYLAKWRTHLIKWICEDETVHPTTKIMPNKYYTPMERMTEGKRRRANVINQLEYDIVIWITLTVPMDPFDAAEEGRAFFNEISAEVSSFLEVQDLAIHTAISTSTRTWLDNVIVAPDVTIRQVLISELTL